MHIGFLAICECEWSHSSFTKFETKYSLAKFVMTHNFNGNHDLITTLCSPYHIVILRSNLTEVSRKVVCIEILSKDMFARMFIKEPHDAVHRCDILDILLRKGQD